MLAPQPETEIERLYARERQVMQAYLRAGYDHCIHVLGRPNLCDFGGRVRAVAQNRTLMDGTYTEFHR